MNFPQKVLKVVLYIVLFLVLLAVLLFKPVQHENYKTQDYYYKTIKTIDALDNSIEKGELQIGWAMANITPDTPLPIASYGIRGDYEQVKDSVFIKAFAFKINNLTKYLVTADLLLFPPQVVKNLEDSLGKETVENIFFTASHTHNGPGGWLNSPVARFIAGPYNSDYTNKITLLVLNTIKRAESTAQFATIKLGKAFIPQHVKNRVIEGGIEEDTLRFLTFRKNNGEKSILINYSAHANCLHYQDNSVSADYPGVATKALQENGFEVAGFSAGAVGSMGNECINRSYYTCMELIGQTLADTILKKSHYTESNTKIHTLSAGKLPVEINGPAPRVTDTIRIRPWVFNLLMGKTQPYISYLKIDNILLLGMPCDFSGEIANKIYKDFGYNDNLLISSFNGTYIGYITPEEYQNKNHSEVREMNWTGVNSGEYFYDITQRLISKLYLYK